MIAFYVCRKTKKTFMLFIYSYRIKNEENFTDKLSNMKLGMFMCIMILYICVLCVSIQQLIYTFAR